MTDDECMQRESSMIATIRKKLPKTRDGGSLSVFANNVQKNNFGCEFRSRFAP
jgi:hypothetical protein